jgi:hypothetical protein
MTKAGSAAAGLFRFSLSFAGAPRIPDVLRFGAPVPLGFLARARGDNNKA